MPRRRNLERLDAVEGASDDACTRAVRLSSCTLGERAVNVSRSLRRRATAVAPFLAFALAALLMPRRANAQSARTFELSWQAPPSCPTSQDIEREIVRLIGSTSQNRATVRAFADVTKSDADWRVRIRIQDADRVSERSFDGPNCRAVGKVASLIIALAIEPNAGAAAEPVAPPPRERPEPQRPATRPEPAEPALRGFVAAGALAEVHLLPRAAFGLEIGTGLRLPALSIELRGGAVIPQPTDVPSRDAGGRFSHFNVGLRVCARIVPRAPELFGCAAGALDILHADGYGVTAPGSATALLGTAALGPRLDLPLADSLRLSLSVEAAHTFSEANFRLDNVGNVHRTPRWGGSARAHVAWLF
jgi:hypothetical protein